MHLITFLGLIGDKAQESFVKETQFASPLVQESVKEIQHKQLFAVL
jgi:dihydroxyacetone kinase